MKSIRCNERGHGLMAVTVLLLLVVGDRISAAPQIVVDQPRWNFGAVTNCIQLKHEFIIRNSGDEPLRISQVISSCNACLQAGINQTNIPPGGTAVVRSYLDLRRLSGPETREIMLDSNDPKMPSYVLELAVVAVPCYRIEPLAIDLDLSQGQRSAATEVTPLMELHAPLSKASCTDSNITARIEQMAANQYMLVLEALKTTPRGDAACGVTVCSIDSNDPPCWVICHIHNPPDLELIPPQLKLQSQDEPQMRILWIKQHGPSHLILLDVLSPTDTLACEIVPEPPGFNYRVNVAAWQQQKNYGRTNWLTLKMRDQDSKEKLVSVPISVN
jgi:hypothetical protein